MDFFASGIIRLHEIGGDSMLAFMGIVLYTIRV